MARGINRWVGGGNAGGDILYGETNRGDAVCTFQIACEDRVGEVTWVRCNVYGSLVEVCRKLLKRGTYVVVDGKLMNRTDGPETVEVRCKELVFLGGKNDKREEEEDGDE